MTGLFDFPNCFFLFALKDSDRKGFRDLLRMDVEDFIYLLEKVTPLIQRRDTKFRRAISARMRLSLTLRFLATGKSVKKKMFVTNVLQNTFVFSTTNKCIQVWQPEGDKIMPYILFWCELLLKCSCNLITAQLLLIKHCIDYRTVQNIIILDVTSNDLML